MSVTAVVEERAGGTRVALLEREPYGDTALAAAAGVVTAAVGAVVAYWVAVIAMLPFIAATVRGISSRRSGPDDGHNGIGGRLNHIGAHRRAGSGLSGTRCATQ